ARHGPAPPGRDDGPRATARRHPARSARDPRTHHVVDRGVRAGALGRDDARDALVGRSPARPDDRAHSPGADRRPLSLDGSPRAAGAPARRDEIGQTVIEFERLVADLADARARLEEETETRRRFELATREMDKLATIGQLAAGLAHEIGSPLQVLEGRLATLE